MSEQSSEPTTEGLTEAEWKRVEDASWKGGARAWKAEINAILADRLTAVQAEAGGWRRLYEGIQPDWDRWVRRAESAEAERDDLRAALDRVKALADEWAGDPIGGDLWRSEAVDSLHAAVEGGRS